MFKYFLLQNWMRTVQTISWIVMKIFESIKCTGELNFFSDRIYQIHLKCLCRFLSFLMWGSSHGKVQVLFNEIPQDESAHDDNEWVISSSPASTHKFLWYFLSHIQLGRAVVVRLGGHLAPNLSQLTTTLNSQRSLK